jgi:peroxiredoxin
MENTGTVALVTGAKHGIGERDGRLRNGQPFPTLAIRTVRDGTMVLPDDLAGSYAVVLFYRGSWCPYCQAQLAAFSRAHEALRDIGVRVVALSADDEATSAAVVDRLRLKFPVGFGADVEQVAAMTGAYAAEGAAYLQSTGFVLDPQGRVLTAVYSSGAIGRLVPDDVAGFVRYVAHEHAVSQGAAADVEEVGRR